VSVFIKQSGMNTSSQRCRDVLMYVSTWNNTLRFIVVIGKIICTLRGC